MVSYIEDKILKKILDLDEVSNGGCYMTRISVIYISPSIVMVIMESLWWAGHIASMGKHETNTGRAPEI